MKVQLNEKQKQIELKATCSVCNMRIRQTTKGSITSWLFGSRCNCKSSGKSQASSEDVTRNETTIEPVGDSDREAIEESFPDLGEQYEVLEFIKEGGMGRVYKVKDKKLNATLAIKLLRQELQLEKGALKRFEQEISILEKLTHINIAPVYGVGVTSTGIPFVAMEYLDGKSLEEDLLGKGRMTIERTLDLAIQICEALSHAHAKGIVHRDLKPSNIIITKTSGGAEIAHIIDFGVARLHTVDVRQSQNLTRTGDVFGSPMYMSPEQCLGIAQDERSDVYSLGCILYEMINGHPPFQGSNAVQTIVQHLNDAPSWKSSASDFQAIVNRCLQKVPDDRYQSVEELQADLLNIRQGVPVEKRVLKSDKRHFSWVKPMVAALFTCAYIAFGFSVLDFLTQYNEASQAQLKVQKLAELGQRIEKSTELMEYALISFPVLDRETKGLMHSRFKEIGNSIDNDCALLVATATTRSSAPVRQDLREASPAYMALARQFFNSTLTVYGNHGENRPEKKILMKIPKLERNAPLKPISKNELLRGKLDSITSAEQNSPTANAFEEPDIEDTQVNEDAATIFIRALAGFGFMTEYPVVRSQELDRQFAELKVNGKDIRTLSAELLRREQLEFDAAPSPKSLKESIATACIMFLGLHLMALISFLAIRFRKR